MSVVCVKVDKIRPAHKNLEEWMQEPTHEYIGRRGVVFVNGARFPPTDSVWANPFKVGEGKGKYTREEAIAKYKEYIQTKLNASEELVEKLLALEGKTLGCWCHPEPCHGDVLLELIQEYKKKKEVPKETPKEETEALVNQGKKNNKTPKKTRKWKIAAKTSENKK